MDQRYGYALHRYGKAHRSLDKETQGSDMETHSFDMETRTVAPLRKGYEKRNDVTERSRVAGSSKGFAMQGKAMATQCQIK